MQLVISVHPTYLTYCRRTRQCIVRVSWGMTRNVVRVPMRRVGARVHLRAVCGGEDRLDGVCNVMGRRGSMIDVVL